MEDSRETKKKLPKLGRKFKTVGSIGEETVDLGGPIKQLQPEMKITKNVSVPRDNTGAPVLPKTEIRMAPPEWQEESKKGIMLSPEGIREKRRQYEDRLARLRYHQAKVYRLVRNSITGGKRLVTAVGRKTIVLTKVSRVAQVILLLMICFVLCVLAVGFGVLIAGIKESQNRNKPEQIATKPLEIFLPREEDKKE